MAKDDENPRETVFDRQFDAFVSYNSLDRKEVEWICEELESRGVHLWVDYEHDMVGRPLPEVLGQGIQAARTGVLIFGTKGQGAWQKKELSMLTSLCTNQRISKLIPVLLPGVDKLPEQFGVYDLVAAKFADNLDDPDTLDRLEEAITGRHPRSKWDTFEIHVEVPALGNGCFVASPLGQNDARYQSIVRAVEQAKMELLPFLGSDQPRFFTDAAKAILAASIVVVDGAPDNPEGTPAPEVLYEWGVADALGKPIIVLDNGRSAWPVVATARRRFEYGDEELDPGGGFEARLAEEIGRVAESQRYPYLIDNAPDDIYAEIYANHVRFIALRPAVWHRLRTIILFGIRIHDRIRDVTKYAHKLEQDIRRVYDDRLDIRQMDNRELHARNWHVFRKTFCEDYLRAHAFLEELFAAGAEFEQRTIENAFEFLIRHLPDSLLPLAKTSDALYRRTLHRWRDYRRNNQDLVSHEIGSDWDGPANVGHLKNLCASLSEHVNGIDGDISEMIIALLEVIAREQKAIGGKSDVSTASQ